MRSSPDTWRWYGFGSTCCDDSRCTSTLKPHRSIPDPNTPPVAFALWDGRVVFPLHPPSSAQIHRLRLQCSASRLKMRHHSSGWIHATVPLCSAHKEPHYQWFPCRGGGERYNFGFIRVHDLLLGCPVGVRVGFSLQLVCPLETCIFPGTHIDVGNNYEVTHKAASPVQASFSSSVWWRLDLNLKRRRGECLSSPSIEGSLKDPF